MANWSMEEEMELDWKYLQIESITMVTFKMIYFMGKDFISGIIFNTSQDIFNQGTKFRGHGTVNQSTWVKLKRIKGMVLDHVITQAAKYIRANGSKANIKDLGL